jgi:hypothetical protein
MVKRMNQLFNVGESPDGIAAVSVTDSGGDDFGFEDTEEGEVSPSLQPAACA